jgi:hypothetical protein
MGMTTKLKIERQNGKEIMRRTRWCAHFRPRRNDGDGRLIGVGKMMVPTSESSNPQHHGVELDEGNSRVVSICTESAWFHRNSSSESSPEFSRCKSSVTVCGS